MSYLAWVDLAQKSNSAITLHTPVVLNLG